MPIQSPTSPAHHQTIDLIDHDNNNIPPPTTLKSHKETQRPLKERLWDIVLSTLVGAPLGAMPGAAIGSPFGPVGVIVGASVGAVVGLVIGATVGFFVSRTHNMQMTLAVPSDSTY